MMKTILATAKSSNKKFLNMFEFSLTFGAAIYYSFFALALDKLKTVKKLCKKMSTMYLCSKVVFTERHVGTFSSTTSFANKLCFCMSLTHSQPTFLPLNLLPTYTYIRCYQSTRVKNILSHTRPNTHSTNVI